MAILVGSALSGVQDQTGAPQQPITAAQLRNIAKDHGLIYEVLTNKKGDLSGGAPTTAGHTHVEAGNLLYWPMSTQYLGSGGPALDVSGAQQYQSAPFILAAAPAGAKGLVGHIWPIDIPAAWAGKVLLVCLEYSGAVDNPQCYATLETWGVPSPPAAGNNIYGTATPVTGSSQVAFSPLQFSNFGVMSRDGAGDDSTLFVAEVMPASSGHHVVRLSFDINPLGEPGKQFFSISVVPAAFMAGVLCGARQSKPLTLTAASISVGDPDGAVNPDLFPVDETLVADDDNMGIAVMANHINSAVLEEWVTGLPVYGATAKTVAKGHDHSHPGSAPWYGAPIEFCLVSHPKGTAETNAELKGRWPAPKVPSTATATTFRKVDDFEVYTPVFAGTSKLRAAVMVQRDVSKACGIEVRITATPSGGGAASVTLAGNTAAGVGAAYELLVHGTALPFQSGGYTQFEVEIRATANSSGSTPAYLGMSLSFNHH